MFCRLKWVPLDKVLALNLLLRFSGYLFRLLHSHAHTRAQNLCRWLPLERFRLVFEKLALGKSIIVS